MKTIDITGKTKIIIGFCFFLMINGLNAQSTGYYKSFLTTDEQYSQTPNVDVLELNNRYYLLSFVSGHDLNGSKFNIHLYKRAVVTILDEDLNPIKQIQISENELIPECFFYDNGYFYVFGMIFVDVWLHKPCLAKFDEDFNLVGDIIIYATNDNLPYFFYTGCVLMTEKKEFVFMTHQSLSLYEEGDSRLFIVNTEGAVLHDMSFLYSTGRGSLVQTDSHYIMNFFLKTEILKIDKDLKNWELINLKKDPNTPFEKCHFEGNAISVGNQLIRTNGTGTYCEKKQSHFDEDISITIFNEDFSIKHNLVIGNSCIDESGGQIGYIKPDSIYLAYRIKTKDRYSIGIANFSSEGVLNFDYQLEKDTLYSPVIWRCKALSNGGVLVLASNYVYLKEDSLKTSGFLLLYHPTRKVSVQETVVAKREIYPNPAQSQFTVTNTENAEIQLFNILGQKVFQTFGTQENTVVNTASLPQGLYVLKVVKDNVSTVHKVQIMK